MSYYLITRPHDSANELSDILNAYGIKTIIDPMVSIETLSFTESIHNTDSFIFTSMNGVLSFAAQSLERNNKIYVLGGATYKHAKNMGFTNIQIAGRNSASALDFIQTTGNKKTRYLYFSGDHVTLNIEKELSKIGLVAKKIICYRSIYAATLSQDLCNILNEGKLAGAIFFSSNSALTFTALIKANRSKFDLSCVNAFAASKKISIALKGLKWNNIIVSEKVCNREIVKLIIENDGNKS